MHASGRVWASGSIYSSPLVGGCLFLSSSLREKQTMGYETQQHNNARFSSFPMYNAAFLSSIGPPSRLIFCDPARPAQELGRIDVAHRCGRHSAAQASGRARGRNVLHHPRLRCCPGNGVHREGAVDETYHANVVVRASQTIRVPRVETAKRR